MFIPESMTPNHLGVIVWKNNSYSFFWFEHPNNSHVPYKMIDLKNMSFLRIYNTTISERTHLAKLSYFTKLDFPEIAGVPFPFQKDVPKLGANQDPCFRSLFLGSSSKFKKTPEI